MMRPTYLLQQQKKRNSRLTEKKRKTAQMRPTRKRRARPARVTRARPARMTRARPTRPTETMMSHRQLIRMKKMARRRRARRRRNEVKRSGNSYIQAEHIGTVGG